MILGTTPLWPLPRRGGRSAERVGSVPVLAALVSQARIARASPTAGRGVGQRPCPPEGGRACASLPPRGRLPLLGRCLDLVVELVHVHGVMTLLSLAFTQRSDVQGGSVARCRGSGEARALDLLRHHGAARPASIDAHGVDPVPFEGDVSTRPMCPSMRSSAPPRPGKRRAPV
jgi:hypothetical protein